MNNPPPQKSFIQPPTFKGRYDEKHTEKASRSNFGNRNFQQQHDVNSNNGQHNNSSQGPEVGEDEIDLPLEDDEDYA